jgi:hypothetical protein
MSHVDRRIVYWFGAPPTPNELAEYTQRDLSVIEVKDEQPAPDFRNARAAVFCAKRPWIRAACQHLKLVSSALSGGLLIYLVAEDDATQGHLRAEIPSVAWQHLRDRVWSRTGEVPAFECAEVIARHDPGPHAEPSLEIHLPPEVCLDEDSQFLLRRAFSDCAKIALQPLSGGRSATAYAVQAALRASEVGPRPMPFFVKLDTPNKILAEQSNYSLYASLHIPWYLRPNLDPKRCLIGLTKGILVGTFVAHSDSLWNVVLDGKGPRYIHALFEETLMGWRSQAYQRPPAKGSLSARLDHVFKYERVVDKHVERAREFGNVHSPRELKARLLDVGQQTWREAPMHGDLHAENVRVRGDDAIIIDLEKVATGPLCADIASLEVWLAFEVPPRTVPNRELWTSLVGTLFAPESVSRPPNLASTHEGMDWLRACVRHTRMISGAVCECSTEYVTAIALHLLRRACYDRGAADVHSQEDTYRRAYAYYLGSRLVDGLADGAVSSEQS